MKIAALLALCSLFFNINAQTGYFKTAKDLENQHIVEFDKASWRSFALGCNINFFKDGEKEARFDQRDIFAFASDNQYYRFYKYAIVRMLIRGEISFFGLVPTQLSFDEKDRKLMLSGSETMLLFISKGDNGDLLPLRKKNILELIGNDAELTELYENKELDHVACILMYNLKHPTRNGFMMNNYEKLTFPQVTSMLNNNWDSKSIKVWKREIFDN